MSTGNAAEMFVTFCRVLSRTTLRDTPFLCRFVACVFRHATTRQGRKLNRETLQ
jgi:hypothetical protein